MYYGKSSKALNKLTTNDNLILSKLRIPTLPQNHVKRPQLLNHLQAGFNYKLILVSAAAGYGKTTLLSDWCNDWCNGLEKRKSPQYGFAWFTIDESDNDLCLFWTYILTAMDTLWQDIKENVSPSLQLIQSKSVEQFLTVLINYLSRNNAQHSSIQKYYVLVLDNYHLIHNKAIHKSLSFLIDLLPPEIKLVISTRVTPQLPLARLRARNQLLELTASDLMFTQKEATIFLNEKMGLTLSTEEISTLQDYMEGWIIGLQLSALSKRESIRNTNASNRYIEEFIFSEVFDGLSEEITNFLIETSNFNRFNAALYDYIKKINYSQRLIEQIEQLNLFIIPLDNEEIWYRYTNFFRDFLQKRFKAYHSVQETDLHLRASKWFEENGLISDAIEQALWTNDIDCIVDLISSVENLPYHQDIYSIYKWLKKIPTATIRANQALSKLAAWTFIYMGCPKDSSDWFSHKFLNKEDQSGHTPVETECILALDLSLSGNYDLGIQLCNKLLDEFKESSNQHMWMQCLLFHSLGESYERIGCLDKAEKMYLQARIISELDGSIQVCLFCNYELGLLQYHHGDLRQAVETYQQALKSSSGNSFIGGLYIGLAQVQMEWNNMEEAAFSLGKAVKILSLSGNIDMLLEAYVAQAQLLMAQEKLSEASELIMKAVFIGDNNIIPRGIDLQVFICQARIALKRGYLYQAEKIDKKLASKVSSLDIINFLSWQCIKVRILIAENKIDEALELLSELSSKAIKQKLVSILLEIMVLKVICYQALKRKSQAMIELIEAIKLAEKQNYIRVFLNEGNIIGMLLYEILYDRKTDPVSTLYKKRLLQAFAKPISTLETPSETVQVLTPLNEPLTERELEILALLNQGMSRQEISEYLKITVNTAKTHIQNIYNKLEVHNRSDLFRISVENKLL